MELANSFTIPIPVEDAWEVLLDVERIAPCMPGAKLERRNGDEFEGSVKVKLGAMGLTYRGKAKFVEMNVDDHRAVIEASAREARGSGTAKAVVTTTLSPRGDETEVKVVTNLSITGKPAQFGRGVMADVAERLIAQFSDRLREVLATGEVTEGQEVGANAEGGAPATAPDASRIAGRAGVLGPSTSAPMEEVEPLDLLAVAGGPMAKRMAWVGAAMFAVLLLFLVVGRSRRGNRSAPLLVVLDGDRVCADRLVRGDAPGWSLGEPGD